VRTEYDYSVVRYLLDVIDEYHAPRLEGVDHLVVVNDLVVCIDGS